MRCVLEMDKVRDIITLINFVEDNCNNAIIEDYKLEEAISNLKKEVMWND